MQNKSHAHVDSDSCDSSGHSHGLTAGSSIKQISDSVLLWAVAANQLLTVAQVVAGVLSGSVALLSDAAHNFSDANTLLIAYIARKISKRRSNERYTFGYRRAEIIGALINLTLLAVVGFYLAYEGIERLFRPTEIAGWMMAATSVLAIVIDFGTAWVLWSMSRGSLNVRAAFVHNIADALGSVAVLIGSIAIILFGWNWVDSVLTIMLSSYILFQVYKLFPQATHILMEGAPIDLSIDEIVSEVESIDGVEHIHHIHVWQLDEQHRALEAHVSIPRNRSDRLEEIKQRIKHCLIEQFQIDHSTLEFEFLESLHTVGHNIAVIANCNEERGHN